MTILESIYIFAVFDVWLYTFFLQFLFEKRFEKKWKHYLFLLVFILLLILLNSRQNIYLNLVGGILLFFCGARVLYKGKTARILFCEVLYYLVATLAESVVAILFLVGAGISGVSADTYSYLENPINIVFPKMLTYLVLLMFAGLFRTKKVGKRDDRFKAIFFLPLVSFVLMIGILQYLEGRNTLMIIGIVLLLFANVFTFYYIEELVKTQKKNKEFELLASQNEMKEIYYEKMEEVSIEHRRYVHNLKNYLQTIGGLAAQDNAKEIPGLLKEMETEIESIREARYTANPILNALLCEKESIAKKKEIAIQIEEAPFITFSFVKNRDLIVMVGNLMDNAIEAAEQCDEAKEINLYFSQEQRNFETIQIDNTYNGILQRDGESFLTTKGDKKKHGFGLKSVKETAAKYGGMVLIDAKERSFSTLLTLSKMYYKD